MNYEDYVRKFGPQQQSVQQDSRPLSAATATQLQREQRPQSNYQEYLKQTSSSIPQQKPSNTFSTQFPNQQSTQPSRKTSSHVEDKQVINRFLHYCAIIIQKHVRGHLQRKRDRYILPRIYRFKKLLLKVVLRYLERKGRSRKPIKTQLKPTQLKGKLKQEPQIISNPYDEQPIRGKSNYNLDFDDQPIKGAEQPLVTKNQQKNNKGQLVSNQFDEQPVGPKQAMQGNVGKNIVNFDEQPVGKKSTKQDYDSQNQQNNQNEAPIAKKQVRQVKKTKKVNENIDEIPVGKSTPQQTWDEIPVGKGSQQRAQNWDDQPVGKKQTYNEFDEQPITQEPQFQEVPVEQSKQTKKKKKQDPTLQENLKKRTKYDPRKAAAEAKKQKEGESQASSSVQQPSSSPQKIKQPEPIKKQPEIVEQQPLSDAEEFKCDSENPGKKGNYLKRKTEKILPKTRGKSTNNVKVESRLDCKSGKGAPSNPQVKDGDDDGWKETAEEYTTLKHTSPKTYKQMKSPSKHSPPTAQTKRIQLDDLERAYSSNYQQKFNSTMSQIQTLVSQRMMLQQQKIPIMTVHSTFYKKFESRNFEKLLNNMEQQYQLLQSVDRI